MRKMLVAPVVVLFVLLPVGAASAAWQRPVSQPIADDWRPPENRYAAGNRGVDFATPSGAEVRSAAGGTVTFAGQVGGVNYVVVDHGNGLRSTYGNLERIDTAAGSAVTAGEVVGTAAGEIHFGVRRGDDYIDPNTLFGSAHLVPLK